MQTKLNYAFCFSFKTELFCLLIVFQLVSTIVFDENGDNINFSSEEQPQVEVRSVFINCEPEVSKKFVP